MRPFILTTITIISLGVQADVKLTCPPGTNQVKQTTLPSGEFFFCVKKTQDGQAVKHGPAIGFRSPGIKSYEGTFANGKKNGEFKFYYESGELKEISHIEADKYAGSTKWFWQNGKKQAEGQYQADVESGRWIFFDENTGKKIAEGPFIDAVAKFKRARSEKEQRATEIKQSALTMGAPCGEWLDFQSQDAYYREIASQAEVSGRDALADFPDLGNKRTVAKIKFEYERDLFEGKTKMKFDPAWCK